MTNTENQAYSDQDLFISNLHGQLTVLHHVLAGLIVQGVDGKVILEIAEASAKGARENSHADGPGAALIQSHSLAGAEQAVEEIRKLISTPLRTPPA
ncbi:hypothetical protein RsS62_63800 [Rhizobium dioscoreae]|uniref:hypothetical protein n=1 Tax=Rhizobium TaxID=379 RepID=UPI001260C779|nr:hypothetical protein [Rhizobium dioscoreae]GES47128.1 hypothetical protein RsS62_63800 [Rhizobium dioscoreae]